MGMNENGIPKTEAVSQVLFNGISSSDDTAPTQRLGWGERERQQKHLCN